MNGGLGTTRDTIPVANPLIGYTKQGNAIRLAIHKVLEQGRYILGEEVQGFETDFAKYIGVSDAIGVANGTDALRLALLACGVGPGDAVYTVAHTAVATIAAIHQTGATPILIDIEPATFTMDCDALCDAIEQDKLLRPRAVIPVHLYGHPVDMNSIMVIAETHGLFVIEDCAQAHGAMIRGQRVGSMGHCGAFSFYPTKNLAAIGDAGCVVTNDVELGKKIRALRQYGWEERYISTIAGSNSRLDELQAAILRVKLGVLDNDNDGRRTIAHLYGVQLASLDLVLPITAPQYLHVYHQYVIRTKNRVSLRRYLDRHSIGTAILYPVPVHLQPGYRDLVRIGPGGLKRTEEACHEILSLPMYAGLEEYQAVRVIHAVKDFFAELR